MIESIDLDGGRLKDLERELFLHRVRKHRSLRTAAQSLGISVKTIYNRLQRSGDFELLHREGVIRGRGYYGKRCEKCGIDTEALTPN